jgi:hypothetical protein
MTEVDWQQENRRRHELKQCVTCCIELTEREWDEGNGVECYDCRIQTLEIDVRRIKNFLVID